MFINPINLMNLFPMLKTTHMHPSDKVYEVGRFSGETNPKGDFGKSSTPTMSMLEKPAVGIRYGEDNDEPGDKTWQ